MMPNSTKQADLKVTLRIGHFRGHKSLIYNNGDTFNMMFGFDLDGSHETGRRRL